MANEPMSTAQSATGTIGDDAGAATSKKPLSPAAERALAEAVARRADIDRRAASLEAERHGRQGPEPVRYGDWEVKGLASDF
jgi:hypothetical protein